MNITISKFKIQWILFACLFLFCACEPDPDDPNDPGNGGNGGNTTEYGTGTETDPFKVANVEDLRRVGSGKEGPGGVKWGLHNHYKQIADIDLKSEVNKKPICNGLSGSYDGDGYTISNLTIVEENDNYTGLFKEVTGIIKNVRLIKVNISGKFNVGGLTGRLQGNGKIDHCLISDFTISGESEIGGLVGYIGNISFASVNTIRDCIVTNGTVLCSDYGCGGGIAGSNLGIIENCYATAYVRGTDAIGGVIGNNKGIVRYCYTTGNITAEGVNVFLEGIDAQFAGGIAGANGSKTGIIQNCVALNKIVERIGTITPLPPQLGRVTGLCTDGGQILNNYARPDMTLLENFDVVPITEISPTSIHGANVATEEYQGANNATWWKNTAEFSESSWDFAAGRLPHLKGFNGLTQNPTVIP